MTGPRPTTNAEEGGRTAARAGADLYLDLLKRSLCGFCYGDRSSVSFKGDVATFDQPFDEEVRRRGLDWPSQALTMVGLERLDNLERCISDVLEQSVPGDLIETGVWRGGASIFMKGVLRAHGVTDRSVWVADSFRGCPPPDARYPSDVHGTDFSKFNALAVSREEVVRNFGRFGLLDERVRFLEGWFRDTLPRAPIERLSVLRMDGDLYESTMDALANLFPKLSVGGYVIVDDYSIGQCRRAVEDFRRTHGIDDEPIRIDDCAVFWRRSR